MLYVCLENFSFYAVQGSEETWGVEDDDDLTDPNFDTVEVFITLHVSV